MSAVLRRMMSARPVCAMLGSVAPKVALEMARTRSNDQEYPLRPAMIEACAASLAVAADQAAPLDMLRFIEAAAARE